MLRSYEDWISIYSLINLRLLQKSDSQEQTSGRNQYSQLIMKVILTHSPYSSFVSHI